MVCIHDVPFFCSSSSSSSSVLFIYMIVLSDRKKIPLLLVILYLLLLGVYFFDSTLLLQPVNTVNLSPTSPTDFPSIVNTYVPLSTHGSSHLSVPTSSLTKTSTNAPSHIPISVLTSVPLELPTKMPTPLRMPTEIPTRTPSTSPTRQVLEVPGEWQWVKLPIQVDYAKYKLNTSAIQGNFLYIHDAQWIESMSCVMIVVMNRNEKGARPPNRGGSLFVPISHFLPSVNISITTTSTKVDFSFIDMKCVDIDDSDLDHVRLLSMLLCRLPSPLPFLHFEKMYVQFRELNVIIPRDRGSASSYFGDKISRRNPPPIGSPRSTVGACVGGVNRNALPYLREFVQYYLLIGVSHLYLSFGANFLVDDDTRFLEDMVADFIKEGLVSIVPGPLKFPELEADFVDAYSKVPFYQSCMWHSKAYDNYTIVVDVDEYVVLYGNKTTATLVSALKEIVSKHEVLCGVQLVDYVSSIRENDSKWIGKAFTGRGTVSHNSRKTIVLTQKANWAWLHRPFRCESNNRRLSNTEGLYLTTELVYMLHFAHLFATRGPAFPRYPPYIPNEYTLYWFPSVQRLLAERCDRKKTPVIGAYCDTMARPTS